MKKTKRTACILTFIGIFGVVFSALLKQPVPFSVCAAASGQQNEKEETVRHLSLSGPQKDAEGNVLWDMVYFGNYWQNDTNGDGRADRQDEKEPVLWRVLSVTEDGKATIQTEKVLEKRRYNETVRDVNWENCTLRSWLNGYGMEKNEDEIDYSEDNFLNEVFKKEEQELLMTVSLQTQKHPYYGTDCGKETEDKVYLLAFEDIESERYGFEIGKENYANLTAKTSYCNSGLWWLRTSGETNRLALKYSTGPNSLYPGDEVQGYGGIRPVVCVDLKKADKDLIKYAGKITSALVQTTKPKNYAKVPVMPVREDSSTTWDCITFGSYYQNDTNQDGKINESDEKEPIKWRVLNIAEDGKILTLLSDKNLESMRFNKTFTEISWGTSAVRSWLNGYDAGQNADAADYTRENFYNAAFSEEEQRAVAETALADTGTTDKVYLLSAGDVKAKKYGFEKDVNGWSYSRSAENTAYVNTLEDGTKVSVVTDWYLRDVTEANKWIAAVYCSCFGGSVLDNGALVGKSGLTVRPVIRLNLELAKAKDGSPLWKYAGTVTTRRDDNEPFFVTDPEDTKPEKGDVDGDGEITLKDAQLALKSALNLVTLTEEQKQAADVSETGEITLKDAQKILRVALNMDTI